MENYKINSKTLAIMPINKKRSKVYEYENVIIVDRSANKIIAENCEYFGSSYQGRKKGTEELIGVTHKAPIIIHEEKDIVFFPTSSPRLSECGWIALNNIEDYQGYEHESLVTFINHLTIHLNISKRTLDNQILRSTRLESVAQKRKRK